MKRFRILSVILSLVILTAMLVGCSSKELTEEQFKGLLTVDDIESIVACHVVLETESFDYKKLAESADPTQVVNMDSWYGMSFATEDGIKSLTFSVFDFVSQTSAQDHFEKMRAETPGLEVMSIPIGDTSAEVEVNAEGIGSIIVSIKGDKLIQLHTAMPVGEEAFVDLEGLEELIGIVESRL